MMAGADFIKTSTGKESINATLPVSLVMARCIRAYRERTGYKIGFKPAGGISVRNIVVSPPMHCVSTAVLMRRACDQNAKTALLYQALMKDELGVEWLRPELFRFGASSLLLDIERQLHHAVTKTYAAKYYMPMA
jgi:deoxyribose-phosphate aldolase